MEVRPSIVYVPDQEVNTYNFSTTIPGTINEYTWNFGDGLPTSISNEQAPVHKYKVEGLYTISLIVANDYGNGVVCRDTIRRDILAKQGGTTKIPNAFTPDPNHASSGGHASNGSFNDVFLPLVKGVETFNMQIFDRWGNLIFESNDSNVGWDGYESGGHTMYPSGVYVYKLTLLLSDGQRTTQIGDVTLIR